MVRKTTAGTRNSKHMMTWQVARDRSVTWPDLDVAPQLRAVGGAGGDRGGGIGMEQAEAAQEREEQSKRPVVWRGHVEAEDEAPPVCA